MLRCVFKKWMVAVFLLCSVSAALAGLSDAIVLSVGDVVMTRSEFDAEKSFFIKANRISFANKTQERQFTKDFAEMQVETQLQLMVGRSMSIALDRADTDVIKQEMLARHGAQSDDEFKRLLAEKGIDDRIFMQQAERQYLLKKIHGYVLSPRIRLSDKAVDARYAQELSKVRQLYVEDIFFSTERVAKGRVQGIKDKAQSISGQWQKRTFSRKTVPNQSKMIAFKWQTLDSLPEQFRSVMKDMRVGEVSEPILTDNGYHVLKLIKTKLPADVQIDKNQIKQQLFVERMGTELPKWLSELREQTYVKIHLNASE